MFHYFLVKRDIWSRSLFLNTVKLRSNFRKMAQFFQLKRLLQSFLTTYFCRVAFKNIAFIWNLYQIYTSFYFKLYPCVLDITY